MCAVREVPAAMADLQEPEYASWMAGGEWPLCCSPAAVGVKVALEAEPLAVEADSKPTVAMHEKGINSSSYSRLFGMAAAHQRHLVTSLAA